MLTWSIGEVLWDIFPDGQRFGGAPLNICLNLKRLGHTATLLSAVGNDPLGKLALARMDELQLSTEAIAVTTEAPTGTARVTFLADGEPSYVIPRPAAFDFLGMQKLPSAPRGEVDWLYFGTLCQTEERVETFTAALAHDLPAAQCFYDLNLRPGQWDFALVQRLSRLADVVKLNEEEASTLFAHSSGTQAAFSLAAFCDLWSSSYGVHTICITLGSRGCVVYAGGRLFDSPGFRVQVVDTVGSGDAFAAAFLHAQQQRWPLDRAARFANALGALVASRPGATPDWKVSEVLEMLGEDGGPGIGADSSSALHHPKK